MNITPNHSLIRVVLPLLVSKEYSFRDNFSAYSQVNLDALDLIFEKDQGLFQFTALASMYTLVLTLSGFTAGLRFKDLVSLSLAVSALVVLNVMATWVFRDAKTNYITEFYPSIVANSVNSVYVEAFSVISICVAMPVIFGASCGYSGTYYHGLYSLEARNTISKSLTVLFFCFFVARVVVAFKLPGLTWFESNLFCVLVSTLCAAVFGMGMSVNLMASQAWSEKSDVLVVGVGATLAVGVYTMLKELVLETKSTSVLVTRGLTVGFLVGALAQDMTMSIGPMFYDFGDWLVQEKQKNRQVQVKLRAALKQVDEREVRISLPVVYLFCLSLLAVVFLSDASLMFASSETYLAKVQEVGFRLSNFLPSVWAYLYDNYTREQIFFLVLPLLYATEIPLWVVTGLDLMKLSWMDKRRIKYSRLEEKRPRVYPSSEILWDCKWLLCVYIICLHFITSSPFLPSSNQHLGVRVHCQNFFGLYTATFLIGVGGACYFQIFPYSFSKELPQYWIVEVFVCLVLADLAFYFIHRFLQ